MTDHIVPVLYVLFLWWFSTGIVLYLDGLPRPTHRWTMLGTTVLSVVALAGLIWSKDSSTTLGAYVAFTSALLVWAWHEVAFLLGYVTGTSDRPCPPGVTGFERFRRAFLAIAWHEIAIAAGAVVVAALVWGGVNQIGMWTYLVLWLMRISAKLNVFLGVPNLAEQFLPPHLAYLRSFLRRAPMNLLFPVSVTGATVILTLLIAGAARAEAGSFDALAYTFAAALLGLALLEHWFLVLRLPDAALWSWALRAREDQPRAGTAADPTLLSRAPILLRSDAPLPERP